MKVVKMALTAALAFTLASVPLNVNADKQQKETTTAKENSSVERAERAIVNKFNLYGNDLLGAYNKTFKMANSNITSMKNNGGHYSNSTLEKAIDGDMNTHWETGKENQATFTNEVTFNLKEATVLDRIVYAARQSSAKGKGFAQEFEVYGSSTNEGDNFTLVSSGEYKGSTGDIIEIQFKPTKFKRLKFVFKKANQNWASASEFLFYKEDVVSNRMDNLFTDKNKNQVSEEFNTVEKLKALEESVKTHPLYALFKDDIADALVLIEQEDIKATTAVTRPFGHYSNEAYSKLFRMDLKNIKSIRNNAGHYASQVIEYAADGNQDTYWETNKGNSADFTNEVEVEFKEAVELDRVMYGARKTDRKGFAEEFEIYASKTSQGDTYQLLSTGGHQMVSGLVEAKFEPTTIKRMKFKFTKSNQNWATLSELAFYKKDTVQDKVNNIFTDGTMSAVVPEFNSIDKLDALEQEAKTHPLYSLLKEQIELAKKIVKGEVVTEGYIITAEQRGDMRQHAQQNLRMSLGTNNQPTGMVAFPGDTITVFVEAESNTKLPNLTFTQQEGSWNSWGKSVQLSPGKNKIVVPKINTDGYAKKVTKGGPIYIGNPYTSKEQGKAPIIRFEGTDRIPLMTENTDPEEFKTFLTAYKQRIDEDKAKHPNVEERKVIDGVEMASEHVMFSGSATAAYKAFIKDGNNPMDTLIGYDVWMKQIFDFYALDGRSDTHDPKRIRENIRVMQPFGFMYAAHDHTGIQPGQESLLFSDFRKAYPGWGLNHEIGHRMAIGEREYGEITNNMLAMLMSVASNNMDNRIPYEDEIYKYVIKENKVTMEELSLGARLGAFWQIELAHPGYWGELNSLYRERKVSLPNGDNSKQQYLIEFSSEVLGLDLSSFFARHGFTVNPETKKKVSKYPTPKNIWYLNNSVVGYQGKGFNENTSFEVNVKTNTANNVNTLTFTIDKENKNNLLGYEIYRDGKLVGFTSSDQFADKAVDTSKNYTYRVMPYDKTLKTHDPIEFKAFKPSISVEEFVTLKLNQAFDPMDYVKATTSKGEDITKDVVVKSSNVDVKQKGNYKIVYEVKNGDAIETKTTKVTVTSDFKYVSDMDHVSANIAWGGLKKDLAPAGSAITLIRQGLDATYSKGIGAHANSEVVYDIEGKGFDTFESYIGIDQAMKGNPSSATFEVWVDGEKKFTSNVFKAETEHEFVKVPVAGAKKIKLVTTDANNNGNTADHTVWADAKFTITSSEPTIKLADELIFVKRNSDFDIMQGVEASDIEDGNLTDKVKVKTNGFNINKAGTYQVEYTVTDSDNNTVTKSREVFVYSDTAFASDIDWKSAQTVWKTVNKDKASVGESIKLLVNGKTKEFAKGIGTHASSEIVYDLEGKNFDYFETLVGVDRNIPENNKSSVTFKFLADGKEVYNSGVMNYNTEAKLVRIPVKGVKNLTLIANDSANGNESDHADFADAKFYISNGIPKLTIPKSTATKEGTPININEQYTATDAEDGDLTNAVQVTGVDQVDFDRAGKYEITYTVIDSDGNKVTAKRTISVVNMEDYNYLSDFDWTSTQNSYTAPLKDISISTKALRLTAKDGSEVAYKKGIGAHSNSTIVYDLTDKEADYFTSFVGVDRQMYGSIGSVIFQVFVDGEKLFDSGLMQSKDPQQFVEVNISGAKELKLIVTDGGNGEGSDHATWGDAKLHFAKTKS